MWNTVGVFFERVSLNASHSRRPRPFSPAPTHPLSVANRSGQPHQTTLNDEEPDSQTTMLNEVAAALDLTVSIRPEDYHSEFTSVLSCLT